MRKVLPLLLLAAVITPIAAQQKSDDDEQVVSVPKKYVSAEGLYHQVDPTPVSKWVGIGREVGIATKEGLNAVVDTAERFGSTKVGTFVMVMIAWRIMAKDVLGVVLGIPLLFAGIGLWVYIAKRLFFGYRVLDKVEGKTKLYKDHPAYEWDSRDARSAAGAFMGGGLILFVAVMFAVIF